MKILEIQQEIQSAIDEVYEFIAKKDYNSFILFIARADTDPRLKDILPSICVVDNHLDLYHDETREEFYLRYLNRNYTKDGFNYQGENGIDDLSIEMMIYCHLWDSDYFIKSLFRIANIVKGAGYLWEAENPDDHKWGKFQHGIIKPIKKENLKLGEIIESAYSSDIRNTFAHSNYSVDSKQRLIYLRPQRTFSKITFETFQKKFLYSVILMNLMTNTLEENHLAAARKNDVLTSPIKTPDGCYVQVKGNTQVVAGEEIARFSLLRIERPD